MLKKYNIYVILILLIFILCLDVNASNNPIDGQPFKKITSKDIEIEIKKENEYYDDYEIIYPRLTIIHPDESIIYSNNDINIENELKGNYNLILMNYNLKNSTNKFSLYKFKNNIKLLVGDKIYKCLGFYDYKTEIYSSAYFSDISYEFEGSAIVNIYGYLLFPKVDLTNKEIIKIVGNYNDSKFGVSWDLNKINQMINIFQDDYQTIDYKNDIQVDISSDKNGNLYDIKVTINNNAYSDVENINIELLLPPGLVLNKSEKLKKQVSIPPRNVLNVSWKVESLISEGNLPIVIELKKDDELNIMKKLDLSIQED